MIVMEFGNHETLKLQMANQELGSKKMKRHAGRLSHTVNVDANRPRQHAVHK